MIRCTTLGWSPSALCYEICVLAYRCEALKEWERRNAMNNKPTVFNYQDHVRLKEKHVRLLETCLKLREENKALWEELQAVKSAADQLLKDRTNLEIKVRILEEQIVATKASADKDDC